MPITLQALNRSRFNFVSSKPFSVASPLLWETVASKAPFKGVVGVIGSIIGCGRIVR